jgi:hypothetical protein
MALYFLYKISLYIQVMHKILYIKAYFEHILNFIKAPDCRRLMKKQFMIKTLSFILYYG